MVPRMSRLNKSQQRALVQLRHAAASSLLPAQLARRIMEALAIAIPSDGHRFFQIEPRTLLISRLLDASANDLDPRNEWLSDVYLRSGDFSYIELPSQMRAGVTALALQDRQEASFGLTRDMLASITPGAHYERFHELRSPTGGTLFGTFHANGLWVAALQAYRRDDCPAFRKTDVDFLRSVGPLIGDAMAASLGHERALHQYHDAPGASGLLLISRANQVAPLTSASIQWLDLLSDPDGAPLASAVLAARAHLQADAGRVSSRLMAPTRVGQVTIEASRSGHDGDVAVVITPAATPDPIMIPPDWNLTAREREIALLALAGHELTTIAERAFLSVTTINWHLSNIYEKTGVNGRSGLVARFFKEVIFPGVSPFDAERTSENRPTTP